MIKKRPTLTVFRSNRYIYAQIVDSGKTLASASEKQLLAKGQSASGRKIDRAKAVGKALAQAAIKKGVKQVRFDRRGYQYHGRVKALAEAAREGGLEF